MAIHKAGLLVTSPPLGSSGDADPAPPRVLLCRKKHTTSSLILPGGRVEPGETLEACVSREVAEELGEGVVVDELVRLGRYEHRAAHDDPRQRELLVLELFGGRLRGTPRAHAEIAQLVWFGPDDDWSQLAPSLREAIFPDLVGRGILSWGAGQ